jgi:hypothetical protein
MKSMAWWRKEILSNGNVATVIKDKWNSSVLNIPL